MLQEYRKELANMKIDPANPHMQCLAELFEADAAPFEAAMQRYATLASTLSGKKKLVAEKCLEEMKKKYIKQ
jgi:hypothetical protein